MNEIKQNLLTVQLFMFLEELSLSVSWLKTLFKILDGMQMFSLIFALKQNLTGAALSQA